MKQSLKFFLLAALVLTSVHCWAADALAIQNPGFEEGWQGWVESDKDGKSVALSEQARNGAKSAKIVSAKGSIAQLVAVTPATNYAVSVYVKGTGILGVKIGQQLVFERQAATKGWKKLSVKFNSDTASQVIVFAQFNGKKSQFDDFAIVQLDGAVAASSQSIRLAEGGLSPDFSPGKNFELIDWYLSTPEDDGRGLSKRISEVELAKGYQNEKYFYTAEDGGMVFRATVAGKRTSSGTKYTRTELREMLRRGDKRINTKGDGSTINKNNWVFSTAPARTQRLAGAVDGTLSATLAVNHVTTTGVAYQIGRVIIGQIHASKDEPIRLYYRKLPNNQRGSIYAAHEVPGQGDRWYEILGSRSNTANDPQDGIALDEKFSYKIVAKGDQLKVIISQGDEVLGTADIDMSGSGYNTSGEYMYFKAGVYNQNNSGEPDDYAQATFYALDNEH